MAKKKTKKTITKKTAAKKPDTNVQQMGSQFDMTTEEKLILGSMIDKRKMVAAMQGTIEAQSELAMSLQNQLQHHVAVRLNIPDGTKINMTPDGKVTIFDDGKMGRAFEKARAEEGKKLAASAE